LIRFASAVSDEEEVERHERNGGSSGSQGRGGEFFHSGKEEVHWGVFPFLTLRGEMQNKREGGKSASEQTSHNHWSKMEITEEEPIVISAESKRKTERSAIRGGEKGEEKNSSKKGGDKQTVGP